jgi:hypothetical protein
MGMHVMRYVTLFLSLQQHAAAANCIRAKAASWGLGSSLFHLIHGIKNVGFNNFYWDYEPSSYTCCNATTDCDSHGWSTFFSGFVPLTEYRHLEGACKEYTFNDLVAHNRKLRLQCQPRLLCNAALTVWRLSTEMQIIVNYEMKKLEEYPRPLIAFQMRGGDKIKNELDITLNSMSSIRYKYAIQDGIEQLAESATNHNGTCVIIGDDSSLASKAADLAGKFLNCATINRVPPHHAHFQAKFNTETLGVRCERTKQVLVDIEILSRAHVSIGVANSNVVRIAAMLQMCRSHKQQFFDWGGLSIKDAVCSDVFSDYQIT